MINSSIYLKMILYPIVNKDVLRYLSVGVVKNSDSCQALSIEINRLKSNLRQKDACDQ